MNPFRSKIICKHCKKKYRRKVEFGTVKFICGGYNNGNGCKKRTVIFQDFLHELIFNRYDRELSNEEIKEKVDYILVKDKMILEIHFTDGTNPIQLKEKFIEL